MILLKKLERKFDVFSILFSPYIKLEALKKVNASGSIKKIVVAWHKEDLLKGVSDLEVYQYCKDNGIMLYRNPQIHLKVIWDGEQNIILGSANITNKGLGLVENSNHELSVQLDSVDENTASYLHSIIEESIEVTEEVFEQIVLQLEMVETNLPKLDDFDLISKPEDYFLLSQLPQSYSPEYLLAIVKSEVAEDDIDYKCAQNDLKTYRVKYSSDEQFICELNERFNKHPFVLKLKSYIDEKGSERYGGIVNWIRTNCTEVPIPRNFELKNDGVVNILYRWLCYFDNSYEVTRPNHSEIIHKKQDK